MYELAYGQLYAPYNGDLRNFFGLPHLQFSNDSFLIDISDIFFLIKIVLILFKLFDLFYFDIIIKIGNIIRIIPDFRVPIDNYYGAYFAMYSIYANDFVDKMAEIAFLELQNGKSAKEVLVSFDILLNIIEKY